MVSSTLSDPLLGRLVDGRYRVVEQLASGGMATVYLALDTRLDRDVALKVMRPGLATDPAFVSKFHREAQSAARLSHPNIVAVFDQGEDDGLMFLVMEYVPGRTLRQVLDQDGPLTPRAAIDLMVPALDGLGYAHAAGIIHRDIKPENVLIGDGGQVKVADFGLARTTGTQTATTAPLMGTMAYLSPEQVSKGIADARSDVYAAGLVLFELLTGTKAVQGDQVAHVVYQHVHTGIPSLSDVADGIPDPLEQVVRSATAKDADERPVDARAMAAALRTARSRLSGAELDARPTGVEARAASASPTAALPVVAPVAAAAPSHGTAVTTALPIEAISASAPPPVRARRRSWPWLLALLLIAGLTAGWYFLIGPGEPVLVPKVAGLTSQAAQAALTKAELKSALVPTFDETVKAGVVISTDPVQGSSVRKGRTIDLLVSKGPERYAVPTLAGQPQAVATAAITQAKLTLGKVTEDFSETVPAGKVISSDPKAGASVKRDTPVALVVSKGRQPITITDFTGKPADQASAALTKAGLKVKASEAYSDTVGAGNVISQTPASGTAYKGDTITLVVSKGPELVTIPDGLISRQASDVKRILEGLGLKVDVKKVFGGKFGTVTEVQPGSGQRVRPGSTVVIVVV